MKNWPANELGFPRGSAEKAVKSSARPAILARVVTERVRPLFYLNINAKWRLCDVYRQGSLLMVVQGTWMSSKHSLLQTISFCYPFYPNLFTLLLYSFSFWFISLHLWS